MIQDLPTLREAPAITAAQMAEVDRLAAVEYGLAPAVLMESAAHQVARVAREMLGGVDRRRIVCLAGTGNNGGDALAAARWLHGWGAAVRCVLAGPPDKRGELNSRQLAMLGKTAVPVTSAGDATLDDADLVVDGLLGFSARGAPRGEVEMLIRLADRAKVPILAVDLPSGMAPDTGEALGVAIRATVTVTLALPKAGLLLPAARGLVGELLLADIGIPAAIYERFAVDARRCFIDGDLVRVVR